MSGKRKTDNDLIGDQEMKSVFDHVVDYIIGKRVGLNGKVEYLVKWEGWHQRTATWEPLANFASPQVVEIFEEGLKKEMGEEEPDCIASTASTSAQLGSKTKSGLKRKKRWSEPMATKFCQDFRRKRLNTKKGVLIKDVSPRKLFDVEVNRIESVIKRYEPLVGASKRKSRMSCPSSPVRNKVSPKPVSQRSQRYRMRYQSNSENKLSNKSHENQNPLTKDLIQSEVISNLSPQKSPSIKKRQMRVNNDSNKMCNNWSENISEQINDFSPESQDMSSNPNQLEKSPSKLFIDKVKSRLSATPDSYTTFLNMVIEFQSINLEFKRLLNDNEELIRDLFDIMFLFEGEPLNPRDSSADCPSEEQEVDELINKWYQKMSRLLKTPQKKKFWDFIEKKDKYDILKASPDYLWLRIKKLLNEHKDLSEEFKVFMPTLCSKIYDLFSNQ